MRVSACRKHLRSKRRGGWTPTEPYQVLTGHENARLRNYISRYIRLQFEGNQRCPWEDLVCHLGDDPISGWVTWSANSGVIPTIRRSSGLLAMPAHNRLLTLRELYLCMGYPTFQRIADAARIPFFDIWSAGLSHSDMKKALGNSMVVSSVGSFVAVVLACLRYKERWSTPRIACRPAT
jgi:site-specific DNA-cytosine methylase